MILKYLNRLSDLLSNSRMMSLAFNISANGVPGVGFSCEMSIISSGPSFGMFIPISAPCAIIPSLSMPLNFTFFTSTKYRPRCTSS